MDNQPGISSTIKQTTQDLTGRVAVVTGGSRGIGKAIAAALVQQNAAVAICARGEAQLKATQEELQSTGKTCMSAVCDVRSARSISEFIDAVTRKMGRVDILVNNAGIYKTEPVASHSLDVWQEILDTNLTGTMLFCRSVVDQMSKRGWGRVINISSVSGRVGEIWGSAYSASKFGVIGFTQSLALEVAQAGITVNAVCPGWVATEMAKEQLADPEWCKLNGVEPQDAIANACFAVPQNRFIEPEEVGQLVAYLASDAARGITGQSINICGGLCLQ